MKRNETVPFAETWMDLESVTQSDVNWKEKNIIYHIISYINTYTLNLEKWCR